MPARTALASANVRPCGETVEPELSSLPLKTSWQRMVPSPLVNSITTRHLIALFPARVPRDKAINPRF
jgi:hypothetical protein